MDFASWFENLASVREHGFTGFQTIAELRRTKLKEVPHRRGAAMAQGVYLALRTSWVQPVFLATCNTCKPPLPVDQLQLRWVARAMVMDIGKAGGKGRKANLRGRLRDYLRFGQGHNSGHSGGRCIWRLTDSESLVVCWKETPDQEPRDVEKEPIREFRQTHNGNRPFANAQD